ncbi:MAG: EAL domain-containing protein, partial [Gammaproteobacteria bacterium]
KQVTGIEVLLRWQHPELGLVMPQDFIPLAEKNGFIVPLGEWVLRNACKQYVVWQSQGLVADDLKFAVNLSPKQLAKEQFMDTLVKILKETGMPPEHLELELTETAVMTSAIDLDSILEQLQMMGIKISIDDFGAGYSSLSRLKNLPVSTLKIDKSFISDLDKDPDDAMIVKSIIALGSNLGLNVIPEGVETEEQLNLLIQYQCPMVQGFYFGKQPLSDKEMADLLQKHKRQDD